MTDIKYWGKIKQYVCKYLEFQSIESFNGQKILAIGQHSNKINLNNSLVLEHQPWTGEDPGLVPGALLKFPNGS